MALAAPGLLFLAAASYLTLERAVTSRESPEGPLDVPELERLSPGEFADEKQAAGDAFARDPLDAWSVITLSRIAQAEGNAEAAERLRRNPDAFDRTDQFCKGRRRGDACEIADGTATDCNANGQPDSCDIATSGAVDCDADGLIDACELAADATLDCDANGVLDAVRAGDIPKEKANDLGIIVSVWLDPSVTEVEVDHDILFETNRQATAKAIHKAMHHEPSIDWLLKNQNNVPHYFHQLALDGQL